MNTTERVKRLEEAQKRGNEILEELKQRTMKNDILLQTTVSKLLQVLNKLVEVDENI